ncbi:MAG: PAS domain S-box protein, partial [Betaproteobacteria bacterium]|nr:PAS domain S-box protein [Betaproteobacteria bacterium]
MQPGTESVVSNRPSALAKHSPLATGVPGKSQATGWLAVLIGLTVGAGTLGLWQALTAQQRAETERAVRLNLESVSNEIRSRMDSRILALVRMARRWEIRGQPPRVEWESDAGLYITHYTGYWAIARVEPDLKMSWLVTREVVPGPQLSRLIAERQRDALQRARLQRDVILAHPLGASADDRALLVNVPIFQGEAFHGFIVGVFRVQATLAAILRPSIASRYAIAVFNGGAELYRRGRGPGKSGTDWSQETAVGLPGVNWRVRVWPNEELIEQRSPLPRVVLVGGLSLALLLALTIHLAQVARLRAHQAESVNRELEQVIAEHREANERLRKLSRAVEQSPTMVLITDRRGAIEYVNPKFMQVTGYGLEEIAAENPRLLKSGETPSEEYRRLWQTITAGEEWRGVLHDRKKNGELFWVHSAISPIRDARGTITHFLAEMEDITEHRRLEQQV